MQSMKALILLLNLFFISASINAQEHYAQTLAAEIDTNLRMPMDLNTASKIPCYIINKDYVIYQEGALRIKLNADTKSFRRADEYMGHYFASDSQGVYYMGKLIRTNPEGFKVIGQYRISHGYKFYSLCHVWKTLNKVFLDSVEIDADASSLEWVNQEGYFKDKSRVYYREKIVPLADPKSFLQDWNPFFFDKAHVYINGEVQLYKGDTLRPVNRTFVKTKKHVLLWNRSQLNFEIIKDIDAKTIEPLSRYFSKDKNHLYYQNFTCPVAKWNLKKTKVWDQYNSVYFSDDSTLYSGEFTPVKNIDVQSFGLIPRSDLFYDKNGIYMLQYDRKEQKAFRAVMGFKYNEPVNASNTYKSEGGLFLLYLNQVYSFRESSYRYDLNPEEIALFRKDIIPERFKDPKGEVLSYTYHLFKRDSGIYWQDRLTMADPSTFQCSSSHFMRDKNHVYQYHDSFGLIPFKGYDMASLSVFDDFITDKYFLYFNDTRTIKSEGIELLGIYTFGRSFCGLDRSPVFTYYIFKNSDGYWLLKNGGYHDISYKKLLDGKDYELN